MTDQPPAVVQVPAEKVAALNAAATEYVAALRAMNDLLQKLASDDPMPFPIDALREPAERVRITRQAFLPLVPPPRPRQFNHQLPADEEILLRHANELRQLEGGIAFWLHNIGELNLPEKGQFERLREQMGLPPVGAAGK